MDTDHPQVKVNYFGNEIEVYEEIVDLLQLIWSQGYKTNSSCQDIGDGYIWIHFSDLSQFQELVQKAHTHYLEVNGDGYVKKYTQEFFS